MHTCTHTHTQVFDVIAKSAYGFAMLYFRLYFDKKLLQAGVTKDDFHKFEVEAMQRRAPKSSPYTGGYSGEDKYYYPDEEADIDYLKQPPMSPGGTRLVDKIRMSKQKMSPEFGSLNQRSFSEEPRGGVLPERRSFEYYEPKQAPTLYSSRGSRSSFIHIYLFISIYLSISTYISIYTCIYIYIYIHIYIHTYAGRVTSPGAPATRRCATTLATRAPPRPTSRRSKPPAGPGLCVDCSAALLCDS